MISDSSYWKRTLASHAEVLNVKLRQTHWRDESFLKVEQAVMMSCYIIRKLAEAQKITNDRFNAHLPLTAFAATGKTVDALNSHRVHELYEVESGVEISKPLSYIANQLIHSYIFVPVFLLHNQLHAVAFNSDRSKSRELYVLKLRPFVEALASCADSVLSSVTYFRLTDGMLEVVPQEGGASNT
jgi:hypothetical protein